MVTPEGKEVEVIFGAVAELVIAELPIQERTPIGPSAILIPGIPRRGMEADSIQPEPASMVAFSSSVMRWSRSATRWSTGREEFLYGAPVVDSGCGFCDRSGVAAGIERNKRAIVTCRVRNFMGISGRSNGSG